MRGSLLRITGNRLWLAPASILVAGYPNFRSDPSCDRHCNIGQTNEVPITLLTNQMVLASSKLYVRLWWWPLRQTLTPLALGMAPGLTSLVMYIGSTDTAIFQLHGIAWPTTTTIGCSHRMDAIKHTETLLAEMAARVELWLRRKTIIPLG